MHLGGIAIVEPEPDREAAGRGALIFVDDGSAAVQVRRLPETVENDGISGVEVVLGAHVIGRPVGRSVGRLVCLVGWEILFSATRTGPTPAESGAELFGLAWDIGISMAALTGPGSALVRAKNFVTVAIAMGWRWPGRNWFARKKYKKPDLVQVGSPPSHE